MRLVLFTATFIFALILGTVIGAKWWEHKIDSILIPPANATVALPEAEELATVNGLTLRRYKDDEYKNVCYMLGVNIHCITTW